MPLNSLAGQLLVAMPQMQDHRFVRSVIYLCLHNKDGAMGLVLNKVIGSLTLPELLTQLNISEGPRRSLLALGYAGWGPNQLDGELQQNGWLHVPADEEILFDGEIDSKWQRALGKLGVDLSALSSDAGHA